MEKKEISSVLTRMFIIQVIITKTNMKERSCLHVNFFKKFYTLILWSIVQEEKDILINFSSSFNVILQLSA